MKDFKIKQASKILGVHVDTIKYWEERRLIPAARRDVRNRYRVYNVDEIKEIARCRGMFDLEVDSAIDKLKYTTR